MVLGHISAFLVVWVVVGVAAVLVGAAAVRRAGKRLQATPEPVPDGTAVTEAQTELASSSH